MLSTASWFATLDIYPNPSRGKLNLHLELSESLVIDLNLVRLDGSLVKKIYAGQLSSGIHKLAIDITYLRSTFYVISCKTRQEQSCETLVTNKLVIDISLMQLTSIQNPVELGEI